MKRIGRRGALKSMAALSIYPAAAAALPAIAALPGERPPYKDPALPVEARVKDLLARMTLEEKVAQMIALWFTKADILAPNSSEFAAERASAMGTGNIVASGAM